MKSPIIWARGLCEGIAIWHIDQNVVNKNLYSVNSPGYFYQPPKHHGVYMVEADKRNDMIKNWTAFGECSDTWKPGQTWANGTLWKLAKGKTYRWKVTAVVDGVVLKTGWRKFATKFVG